MSDLLVRNLAETTLDGLKRRASHNRRSLQQELHSILDGAVHSSADAPTAAEITAAIRARLQQTGREFSDSADLVREDRQRWRQPGKLVIDASVAAKWYLPEVDSEQAAALLAHGEELIAPDLLVAELGNVLWKKRRRGELSELDEEEISAAFTVHCPVRLVPSLPYLQAALELAATFDRTVYDSLYLALALAEDCPLVTADARFQTAFASTPLSGIVKVLSDA